MKKLVAGLFLGLLFSSSIFAQDNYPKPIGHVTDSANIINPSARQELEAKLREYRDKTSIEIAIVTVLSLNGLSVEEYTLNWAQKWGVGDKKKDNGIVLLVAPVERKMRIEVGYGMEPDLTDVQAKRIIDNTVIPYFKESVQQSSESAKKSKLTEGIVAGVNAILAGLGNTPYQNRLEERKIAAEKAAAEQKLSDEQFAATMKIVGLVVIAIVIIGSAVFIIFRIIGRRNELRSQFVVNGSNLKKCRAFIVEAEKEYPSALKKLDELREISPKNVWADLETWIVATPGRIKAYSDQLEYLMLGQSRIGWKHSDKLTPQVTDLLDQVSSLANVFDDIKAKIAEVKKAQHESPGLLEKLAGSINKAAQAIDHADVSKRSKQYVGQARDSYKKAKSSMDNSVIDWLAVSAFIMTGLALAANALSGAKSDKEDAEEARKPKPKRSSSGDYSSPGYSSGWSSGSSSGYDSGGSSFGGFGGGSFGGGGASGSL